MNDKRLTYNSANRGARLLVEKGVAARAVNIDDGKHHAIILKDGTTLIYQRHFNEAYEGALRLRPTLKQKEEAAIWARM